MDVPHLNDRNGLHPLGVIRAAAVVAGGGGFGSSLRLAVAAAPQVLHLQY